MNPLQDIFISYGRADSRDFAQYLCDRLAQHGYTVWYDFHDIPQGVDYQKQIDDAIEKADNFLFIISPHATNSPYCRLEIERAIDLNKRLVPIMHVEQISRETWQQRHPNGINDDWAAYTTQGKHSCFTHMHPAIAKINWNQVSFRDGIDDVEQSFQALTAIFERQQDYVHQHTVWLNRALDWERNQKQTQYLLIGEDRQTAEQWLSVRFDQEQAPCLPTDLHCEFITESIKNANNMMTQVFLCHAEVDGAIAEQVRRTLLRSSITTWTHRIDIEFGSDFQAEMSRGVEEADNILFLMSPDALESPYCQKELAYALELNKRIIPIRIRNVEPAQIPEFLQNLQYINLTDNLTDADYQKDESDLLRILKRDAAFFNEHKVLLTKALKWERQQHNPCILLRGYELQHALAWLKVATKRGTHRPTDLQREFIAASERQPSGINLDVFISYARADSDFARKLNDGLQRQGKRTWFDQESIASGADFQQEIYRGIEASDHFLFILSPKAVASSYCANEVEYAAKLNKRIITVRHQAVEADTLHPELAKVQWIDFQDKKNDFATAFRELIRILDVDPEYLRSHTRLLLKALEWRDQNQDISYLLRGIDLDVAEKWLEQSIEKRPNPSTVQTEYIKASTKIRTKSQRANQRTKQVLIASTLAANFLMVIGFYYATYQFVTRFAISNLDQGMKDAATGIASQIDLDSLIKLYETVEPVSEPNQILDNPLYHQQLNLLDTAHSINPKVWPYVFVIVDSSANEGNVSESVLLSPPNQRPSLANAHDIQLSSSSEHLHVVFLADIFTYHDPSRAAQVFEVKSPSQDALEAYSTGEIIQRETIYQDFWGSWISTYTLPMLGTGVFPWGKLQFPTWIWFMYH